MMPGLASGAAGLLHVTLTPEQLAAFQTYAAELAEWNSRFNLTAITDPEAVQVKHFLDSLTCLAAFRAGPWPSAPAIVDVGAGAGFPGLPLKIVCPTIRLTLVEATGKKAKFLQHMVERLELSDVTVLAARAEDVGQDPAHRERYDWAVARAVAELSALAEYLLPLVKVGGRCLAMKGEHAAQEAQAAEKALRLLGGRLEQIMPLELPGVPEPRHLVVMSKHAATPSKYPRRPGLPAKSPLK